MERLDFSPLIRAKQKFDLFSKQLNTEQEKAGAVQAFEYTYELAWKILKKILATRGIETGSPKTTFRKAREEKLIEHVELWFEFVAIRNLTVHTYNERNLEKVLDIFPKFSKEVNYLIERLQDESN